MKRTESIQVRLPDGGRLHLRVSPEEKEMIRSKAEAEKMTMSSLILRALDKIDNPITVNLDEYKRVRELVSKIESMKREEAAEIAKKIKQEKIESVNEIKGHFE